MIGLAADRLAAAAGGRLLAGAPERAGPQRAVIDSRLVEPGDLFVGLPGATADGGRFAPAALESGAWGVLVADDQLAPALAATRRVPRPR